MAPEQPKALDHFLSIPWCARHLSESNIRTWDPPPSRLRKASGEDELFARTLNTRDTFPAFILFYHEPSDPEARIDELKAFITVKEGVQGYSKVVHGGIVATILDEVLGAIPAVNMKRRTLPKAAFMTGYLNTSFIRPVKVPSTVLVTTRIVKIEDRKLFVAGDIRDEDGHVLAKADALFIAVKREPRL